jgi:hypothetical protein
LESGELRRQIGLKLRAQDTCNVIYVMWHIEPATGIVVSVKRNRGQRTHVDCGARGYTIIRAARRTPVPTVEPGSWHSMRAALGEGALTVWSDGAVVWEGALPVNLIDFDGPVGVRSDNARFEIEYLVGE